MNRDKLPLMMRTYLKPDWAPVNEVTLPIVVIIFALWAVYRDPVFLVIGGYKLGFWMIYRWMQKPSLPIRIYMSMVDGFLWGMALLIGGYLDHSKIAMILGVLEMGLLLHVSFVLRDHYELWHTKPKNDWRYREDR